MHPGYLFTYVSACILIPAPNSLTLQYRSPRVAGRLTAALHVAVARVQLVPVLGVVVFRAAAEAPVVVLVLARQMFVKV